MQISMDYALTSTEQLDSVDEEGLLVPLCAPATSGQGIAGRHEMLFEHIGRSHTDPSVVEMLWNSRIKTPLVILSNVSLFVLGYWLGGRQ